MARFSKCTEQYAQKVFDSADIVRDAILHQLTRPESQTQVAGRRLITGSCCGFCLAIPQSRCILFRFLKRVRKEFLACLTN